MMLLSYHLWRYRQTREAILQTMRYWQAMMIFNLYHSNDACLAKQARQEVMSSIPALLRPLSTRSSWIDISKTRPVAQTEVMVSPLFLCVAAHKNVRRQSWDPSAI